MSNSHKIIKIGAICLGCIIIINIIGGILWAISLFSNVSLGNKNGVDVNKEYTYIDNIIIDLKVDNLILKDGDKFMVDAENVSKRFSVKERNGELKIEEKDTWIFHNNSSGEITIYIPSGTILNNLEIDNGAGKIDINNISANNLEIDQGAGSLTINNSQFNNANIEGGVGLTTIKNTSFGYIDLDADVGKTVIEALINSNGKIDCGIGEVNLMLEGVIDDYRIIPVRGIGSIKIDGQEVSNNTTYGTGNKNIRIEGGIGNINIDFKENIA